LGKVRGKTFIAMKDRLWSMKRRGLPDQSSCGSSAGQIQKFMTSLPDYLKVVREDPTNTRRNKNEFCREDHTKANDVSKPAKKTDLDSGPGMADLLSDRSYYLQNEKNPCFGPLLSLLSFGHP